MIYGYIRVSTMKQTVENQRFEIRAFCRKNKMTIDGWIEETVSGAKDYDRRKLGELLKDVKKGDLIICVELSRLGRNLFMIMEILNLCMQKECRVWTIKDGYRLGDDIQSKVLAFAFGLSAEIERNLLSQRTKEAMARLKAEGRKFGRPVGYRLPKKSVALGGKDRRIIEMMNKGFTWAKIARKLKVHRQTVQRYVENYMPDFRNYDSKNFATFPKFK